MAIGREWSNAVVVVMAIAAAALVVLPAPEYSRNLVGRGTKEEGAERPVATLLKVLSFGHLTCFATTFGVALWVSFIGGIIMFKHLPRHQFGNLQAHMFPAYFKLTSGCMAINIAIFAILHPWALATRWEKVQVWALGLSLLLTLINLLLLEPMTTKLMRERHKAEKEDGISTEPGVVRSKEIEKASPKLRAVNKKFGMIHGISSLLNLFAFWGIVLHAFYLASKLVV